MMDWDRVACAIIYAAQGMALRVCAGQAPGPNATQKKKARDGEGGTDKGPARREGERERENGHFKETATT